MPNFVERVLNHSLVSTLMGVFRAPTLTVTAEELNGIPNRTTLGPERKGLPSGEVDLWHYPAERESGQSRPWFFMIHGFRGDHHGLVKIADALVGYEVVVPDLPGFGSSPAMNSEHDVENYAQIMGELLDSEISGARKLEDCVVVGHSFGSLVATKLATSLQPGALALINPIAQLPLSASNRLMAQLSSAYYGAAAALPEGWGHRLLSSPLIVRFMTEFMVVSDEVQMRAFAHDQHRQHFSGYDSRAVVQQAYAASISHHCGIDAPLVKAPTLLIAGDHDPLATVAEQEQLQSLFTQPCGLRVLSPVGHLIHYEMPGAAATELMNFAREYLLDQF